MFGEKLEIISDALMNFGNKSDTTVALRAQGGEKANNMTEPEYSEIER